MGDEYWDNVSDSFDFGGGEDWFTLSPEDQQHLIDYSGDDGGGSGLFYDPSISWESIIATDVPAEDREGFQQWLAQEYPELGITERSPNLDELVWSATGGDTTDLIPGVNAIYNFGTGEYVPAMPDQDGNLFPVSSGNVSNTSGFAPSSPSFASQLGSKLLGLISPDNLLGGLSALAGGALNAEQLNDLVESQNEASKEAYNARMQPWLRAVAGILPEYAMPSANLVDPATGKQIANPDGSPIARAQGLQSKQAPWIDPATSSQYSAHEALRSRMLASGGKVGGMNAIKQDPVIHKYLKGYRGGGQADNIHAMLSPNEYVFDADAVAALGDGNPDEGARKLDKMRENIRQHKRSAPKDKIPPKAKAAEHYLKD